MLGNIDLTETTQKTTIGELRRVLKRLHYPLEVMRVYARCYAAYPLSFRHLEEMIQERGVFVDHSTNWHHVHLLSVVELVRRETAIQCNHRIASRTPHKNMPAPDRSAQAT